jgi:hypothetical protein
MASTIDKIGYTNDKRGSTISKIGSTIDQIGLTIDKNRCDLEFKIQSFLTFPKHIHASLDGNRDA